MIEYEDSHHLNNQFAEYLVKNGKIDWYNEQEEHIQRKFFDLFFDEFLYRKFHTETLINELFYQVFLTQQRINEVENGSS